MNEICSHSNNHVLRHILRLLHDHTYETANRGQEPLALVCDLDSTVFDTRFRSHAVFQEFAHLPVVATYNPKLSAAIKAWQQTREVYDPIDFLQEHIPRECIPDKKEYRELIRNFWRLRFFHPSLLSHDQPYAGVQKFLQKIAHSNTAKLFFLSARCQETTYHASIESLRKYQLLEEHIPHGFYNPKHAYIPQILLKPKEYSCDRTFKLERLRILQDAYPCVIYIDNEAYLVQAAQKTHPTIHTFFYKSIHSNRVSADAISPHITFNSWQMTETDFNDGC